MKVATHEYAAIWRDVRASSSWRNRAGHIFGHPGWQPSAAIGGALFLFSDLLIGTTAAGLHIPAHEFLVMTTYALALALSVTGWRRSAESG